METLQAMVLIENKAMMALLAKRGLAIVGHPDWSTVQIVFATDGSVPTWGPDRARPRVLVETDRSRWRGEDALTRAGFDLLVCDGLYREGQRCPVLHGETCPLVGEADAVIVDLPDDDAAAELVHSEQLVHPGARFIAARRPHADAAERGSGRLTPDEILDEIEDLLDRDDPARSDRPDRGE